MNTNDMTSACVFLTNSLGKNKAARSLGISQQTLKKYLGFAAVPDDLKVYVPKKLSRDDATKLCRIIPNVSQAIRIAEKIIPLDKKLRKQYLYNLARNPKSSHLKLLKNAKVGLLKKKVILTLNKSNARKLHHLAAKNDVEVTEMARKIMSDYLRENNLFFHLKNLKKSKTMLRHL